MNIFSRGGACRKSEAESFALDENDKTDAIAADSWPYSVPFTGIDVGSDAPGHRSTTGTVDDQQGATGDAQLRALAPTMRGSAAPP